MKEIVCMNKKTIEITNKNIWQTRRFLWKLILVIVAQIQRKKESLMQAWKLSTWEYILLLKDSNLTFSSFFGFSSMYWAFDFLFLNVYTMACIRKSTKPHLCSKLQLFKTSWQMLRVLFQLRGLVHIYPI